MGTVAVAAAAAAAAGIVVGAAVLYLLLRASSGGVVNAAKERAREIKNAAETSARQESLRAEHEALQYRREIDSEVREQRQELTRTERRIEQREEAIERRADALERAEEGLRDRTDRMDVAERGLETERVRTVEMREQVAGMTAEEARAELLETLEDELADEAGRRVRAMEASAKAEGDARARKVLATVMQRMTTEITAETTVSLVPLPSDELKGRIIGREGRNIRAFEAATGCDLIIDDTPGVVTITGFDPVRREVARVALARLIEDGRIQPTRIEEAVTRARSEVEQMVEVAGDEATVSTDVMGLHPEVVKTLGRLRFRYSYGQNQLRHSIETSWLAAAVAAEIGADIEVCRVGGLLHDLGKAVDREHEGTHARIGADIARRLGVPRPVVHCIEAHHEEVRPDTTEAVVVMIADAISGGRPGARRESIEEYVKRLEALEAIANSFEGVNESFAIQAGREIRVIVEPESIDDLGAARLARDVSRKIEETMQYPGEIRVTVVRETRASATAH